MKHANGWPQKLLSAGGLFLDPKNPRIAPSEKPRSERELIEELLRHENVIALIKNIAANGFFPSEPLVAVQEDGKKYVVEGNRRLAATKLLLNSSLAPVSEQKKIRAIANNFSAAALAQIPVLIAPSREAAYPLIIARHTDTQIEKWDTAMKAHFYGNLIDSGLSVDDIAQKFHVPAVSVREALHDHNLYRMACRLELGEAETNIVRDSRKFKLTTLKRVFESPAGRDFFGVELAENGKVVGKLPSDEFKKGFSRLVSDVAMEKQDSRTLNTPDDIKKYLNGFSPAQKPDKKKKGSFDSDSFLTSKTSPVQKPAPAKSKKNNSSGIPIGLIPSSFPCGSKNTRIQILLRELQKLSPASGKFPNACAFAFRSFLEISAFCYLDGKGEIKVMQNEYVAEVKKKNANRPPDKQIPTVHDWTPDLNAMMKRLGDGQRKLFQNNHTVKALNKVINEEQELFGLNLSTHNPTYHPNEARLRATWQNLEEFFREILA